MIKIVPHTKYTELLDKIVNKFNEADDEIEKFNIHFEKQATKRPLSGTVKSQLEYLTKIRTKLIGFKNELDYSI